PMPTDSVESEARNWLGEALSALAPDEHGTEVHTHTEEGDPAQRLLDHCTGADLLVLGNHGRGAVMGALLGSVAQRCAHHARCPVVLVPGGPESRE
ncbi:MAG: universal stress protein, partial [Actinomycetes bacterium]